MADNTTRKRHRRTRFGQHFLRDPIVLDQVIEFFNPRPGERVVEIGAGRGEMTRFLAQKINSDGLLVALELDNRLAEELKQEFADKTHISIIEVDALDFDFFNIPGMESVTNRIRVIGNLPYYAGTAILLNIIQYRKTIRDVVVMLQKEVANRIIAQPGTKDYGTLTLAVQLWCDVEWGFDVGPEAFSPPPKVFSTVLRLIPNEQPRGPIHNPEFFERLSRAAFAQRRKTLFNNLQAHFGKEMKDRILDILTAVGIKPSRRAETLSLIEFAKLSDALSDNNPRSL